jgi:sortase (surface protein transpeptidase)
MNNKGRRRRSGHRALMVPATLAGAVLLVVGMGVAPLFGPANTQATAPSLESSETVSDPGMDPSEPTSLIVPAMELREPLLELGTKKDEDFVELPPPSRAGWFTKSVTPGEVGIATIVGYIRNSANQPGVFSNLADLTKGDKISVKRDDGTKAVFRVNQIETYAEGKMSQVEVYALTDRPELRLITSGGKMHPDDPAGNVVVFAHLVDKQ